MTGIIVSVMVFESFLFLLVFLDEGYKQDGAVLLNKCAESKRARGRFFSLIFFVSLFFLLLLLLYYEDNYYFKLYMRIITTFS